MTPAMRHRFSSRTAVLCGLLAALAAAACKPKPAAEVVAGARWRYTTGAARGSEISFGAGQQASISRPGQPLSGLDGSYEFVTPQTVRLRVRGLVGDSPLTVRQAQLDTRFDVQVLSDDRVVFARGTQADTLERVGPVR